MYNKCIISEKISSGFRLHLEFENLISVNIATVEQFELHENKAETCRFLQHRRIVT